MNEFHIKPAAQRLVRDPISGAPLSDDGEIKPKNSYWLRRLKDGDVVEIDQNNTANEG